MALYKTNCIILRSRNFGEADRVILVLSEDRGKFEVVVKGARRARSRFVGNTLPFNFVRVMLLSGKNLDTLSQAELVHSFVPLREDLLKMAYASFWTELVDSFLPEKEEAKEIFLFLLAAFVTLEKTAHPAVLHLAFEARLLNSLGYQPELSSCLQCGKPVGEKAFFAAETGGVICYDCRAEGGNLIPVSRETLSQMRSLSATDLRELEGLHLNGAALQTIERILRVFIETRLDHSLKTQVFLDSCLQP